MNYIDPHTCSTTTFHQHPAVTDAWEVYRAANDRLKEVRERLRAAPKDLMDPTRQAVLREHSKALGEMLEAMKVACTVRFLHGREDLAKAEAERQEFEAEEDRKLLAWAEAQAERQRLGITQAEAHEDARCAAEDVKGGAEA